MGSDEGRVVRVRRRVHRRCIDDRGGGMPPRREGTIGTRADVRTALRVEMGELRSIRVRRRSGT